MSIPQPPNNQIEEALKTWRARAQTRMMMMGLMLVFPAIIHTVVRSIDNPQERSLALVFVFLYLGIVGLYFLRKINVQIRGWALMLLIYLTGVFAMVRGGLAGDGRVYLLLLPVFGVVLVSVRAGIALAFTSTITFIVFGFLAHFGWLEQWLIVVVNPVTYDHWLYDGLVFVALMGTAVFMLVDFYIFLIKTLTAEQENAERLREAHQLLDQTNLSLEEKVKQRTLELADANRRLRRLVDHDPLTGLPNRILFYKHLDNSITQAQHHDSKLAILFIDLDNFKQINDSFGHLLGDRLLTKVAVRLQKSVRESDTVARLSGDEFAIIIEELSSENNASVVVKKLIQSLSKPFELDDLEIDVSASIGVSIFPLDGEDADVLVRRADTAMYRVKHSTKDDFQFYKA